MMWKRPFWTCYIILQFMKKSFHSVNEWTHIIEYTWKTIPFIMLYWMILWKLGVFYIMEEIWIIWSDVMISHILWKKPASTGIIFCTCCLSFFEEHFYYRLWRYSYIRDILYLYWCIFEDRRKWDKNYTWNRKASWKVRDVTYHHKEYDIGKFQYALQQCDRRDG